MHALVGVCQTERGSHLVTFHACKGCRIPAEYIQQLGICVALYSW